MQEDDAVSRNERGDEQVLSAALRRILHAIDNFDELDSFIDEHCAEFAAFAKNHEHQLHWTSIHAHYVQLMEAHIEAELCSVGCTSVQLYMYATTCSQRVDGDVRIQRQIQRLVSLGDYPSFCEMMSENHAINIEFGPSRVLADSSDSDDE